MPFKKGQSGNPSGLSSKRRSFIKRFMNDLEETYNDEIIVDGKVSHEGIEAIRWVRDNDPVKYVQMIFGLLPKDVQIDISDGDIWTEILRNNHPSGHKENLTSPQIPPGILIDATEHFEHPRKQQDEERLRAIEYQLTGATPEESTILLNELETIRARYR